MGAGNPRRSGLAMLMRNLSLSFALLGLLGCPAKTPAPVAPAVPPAPAAPAAPQAPLELTRPTAPTTEGPQTVLTGAQLALLTGARIIATGTLVRGDYPTGGHGTALLLDAGAKLWVATDGVPEGWESMLDKRLTLTGTLVQGPTAGGQRIKIPFLDSPEPPVLAEQGDAPL